MTIEEILQEYTIDIQYEPPTNILNTLNKLKSNFHTIDIDFDFKAYLGYKNYDNMIQHAVLVEQTVINDRDVKNALLLIIQENDDKYIVENMTVITEHADIDSNVHLDFINDIHPLFSLNKDTFLVELSNKNLAFVKL